MEREILEYEDDYPQPPPPRPRQARGCGCFTILFAAVLLWGMVSIFTDGGISCCAALLFVTILFIIFRVLEGIFEW